MRARAKPEHEESARPRPAAVGATPATAPAVLRSLQRTVGNAAVVALLAGDHRLDDEPSAMAAVDAVTRRSGSPMKADLRDRMEHDYGGEDFGDVRTHVDRDSAEAVGAKAYTTKTNHIVFRSPADMDDHTVRHELQHVRQQRLGGVPAGVSRPDDPWERDAEDTATDIGRGSPEVQRVAADGHRASGDGVQRVRATDKDFWARWAGADTTLTGDQKRWVFEALNELAKKGRTKVRDLKVDDAVKLLYDNDVTPASMAQGMDQASAAERERHSERAHETVKGAGEVWQQRQPDLPEPRTVSFDIGGLGRGTVAVLKGSSPKHKNMLAWFSHGYEDVDSTIMTATARQYGFAVAVETSLNRIKGSPEEWSSLPDALAESDIEPTNAAPAEYVRPHHATELTSQVHLLHGLLGECDVAVLLDFDWADNVEAEYADALRANTPPLPTIVDREPALAEYRSLLIYACRTPWGVDAAAVGSKLLKDAEVERIRTEEPDTDAAEARRRAEERYESGPTGGVVHRGGRG
ncbi:hypothetical protein GCM10022243_01380 [Saccharothrix violaceirubra]|uniref:eCIS core domain-containing protein n=1 Tax=Saccharothrix violaceirubra TaxID=413306 RepID=A0A7W7T2H5_9PSEU|nr:DUF4157 domain-containing protein [Saccharothrix violaceirubra]MBB4965363.1 hypothetical protein [Saccharothrix violaceirubra]